MSLSKEPKKYTYSDYLTYPDDERWEIIDDILCRLEQNGFRFTEQVKERVKEEVYKASI